MAKKVITTDQAASAGGPYTQAVVAGDHVYLAGATPKYPDGTLVTGSVAEQARQVFTNLARVAEAAGSDLSQAVRVGVYLRDFADFAQMNDTFAEFFDPENSPARTTVPAALHGFDIEVDVVLYTGG